MVYPEVVGPRDPTTQPEISAQALENSAAVVSDKPVVQDDSLITEKLRVDILEAQMESAVTLLGS